MTGGYVDYHAAFAPFLLGHNRQEISDAVIETLSSGVSLFGAGSSRLEGDLAAVTPVWKKYGMTYDTSKNRFTGIAWPETIDGIPCAPNRPLRRPCST